MGAQLMPIVLADEAHESGSHTTLSPGTTLLAQRVGGRRSGIPRAVDGARGSGRLPLSDITRKGPCIRTDDMVIGAAAGQITCTALPPAQRRGEVSDA